jgi:ketosteroid isomerase-like protein
MSQENVDVVARAVEAFNERGLAAGAIREFFADDAEFHEPPEQPGPRVARGIEEIEMLFGEFEEAWAKHQSEPEEIRAVGTDKVLLLSVERFVGRDGIELAAPLGSVFTLRDGKIVRWQAFWERQRAIEAAGLQE